jgi:hypothetical protein
MAKLTGDRVRDLANSEVMTWRLNDVPMQVAESQGPLKVSLRGEVVRMYPWYTHPAVRKGVLYIIDVLHHGRVLDEHLPGSWDEVIHDVRLAGLY